MSGSDFLDDNVLHESLRAVFAGPGSCDKLGWWLGSGFSTERWLQFEFAFALDRRLQSEYTVGCESKWVDITIYEREPVPREGIWTKTPMGEIELKVRGNWFVQNPGYTFGQISDDRLKVKLRSCPAAALTVWYFCDAASTNVRTGWLEDQVKRGTGVAKFDELLAKLEHWKVDIKPIGEPINLDVAGFNDFVVYLFGFKNDRALK